MNRERLAAALLAVAMALTGLLLVLSFPRAQAQGGDPITLSYNLGSEPLTLDPAKAVDSASITVIEQLFIGLVDIDDETGEVVPELATTWDISPDSTVYTFTLRSEITWTDGHPVTAQDVRYGILHTLEPATESGYAFFLYAIENAEAYNTGQITDPDQVGVEVLDNTHLRITLGYPASHFPSIAGMLITRPLPQWVIEAHGDAWTEPENIVTNGPYRLADWVHDDHITLEKNLTYYDAANVQIEQVRMWMVDEATGWTMYLNGQLDTASVPSDQLDAVRNDPILSRQLHIAPVASTSYYGFSVAQSPFDTPLVRKAFIAAVNRQGLIDTVLDSLPKPALTFTAPGVFGHVDGQAKGVGIPYEPDQARQWLADAGYPDGQGLPEITIWFSTRGGNQAIAEYIRQNWINNLDVTVRLEGLPWGDYWEQVRSGEFQIWQLRWLADYNDAYNFLHDAVVPFRSNYGNWANDTYDDLLAQAVQEQDLEARRVLYKQAEEILVESDAVMMPLYYYAGAIATKPDLQRTYPSVGAPDIATWRIIYRIYLPMLMKNY